jgi:hypothetical protein
MMAKDIDLEAPFVPENKEKICGEVISKSRTLRNPKRSTPPDFDPMRRKLKIN